MLPRAHVTKRLTHPLTKNTVGTLVFSVMLSFNVKVQKKDFCDINLYVDNCSSAHFTQYKYTCSWREPQATHTWCTQVYSSAYKQVRLQQEVTWGRSLHFTLVRTTSTAYKLSATSIQLAHFYTACTLDHLIHANGLSTTATCSTWLLMPDVCDL